ncbi:MAG: hypothetical protein IPF93_15600 [Saprospiraceae bacterium]|nr:hypothetical protein [Saprospiraceae bacterium]
MNQEELLNKYFQDELTPNEMTSFETFYNKDEQFKKEVDFHKSVIAGIKMAGIDKIRQEVATIHDLIMPSIYSELNFESDLSRSLQLKNQEAIRKEIQQATKGLAGTRVDSKEKVAGSPQAKIISLRAFRSLSIAASMLLILSLGIYFVNKRISQDSSWGVAMSKAYESIRLGSNTAGLADPNQSIRTHQRGVFDLIDQNQFDSARRADLSITWIDRRMLGFTSVRDSSITKPGISKVQKRLLTKVNSLGIDVCVDYFQHLHKVSIIKPPEML